MSDFKEFLDKFKSRQALYLTLIRLGLAKPIEKPPATIRKVGRRSRRRVARK